MRPTILRQGSVQTTIRSALLLLISNSVPIAATADEVEDALHYVGSQKCVACHEEEGQLWSGSHHALAWTPATSEFVVADFDGTEFSGAGLSARFSISEDGEYHVSVTEADNTTQNYTVHSVVGIEPLQQYLLETENGRLQSFDVVWDVEEQQWYHLYPDQDLKPQDGLHWTGSYKNWNGRCAECHATGYEKNYDYETRSFASRQAEIGVGCEACHGPGSSHVEWIEDQVLPDDTLGLTPYGFSASFIDTESTVQQCATCHSRRETFGDGNPVPGTAFHDSYNLALLRPELYHADGQILDEVFVYGSFLQSKMYERGVGCLDCHDAHTAQLWTDGNAVCTQCHSPAGNPAFPSLRLVDYDTEEHHFHAPDSDGAQCKSCHMIERTYMGIDGRRDHSFRIPRPDLASSTGAPDACTDCHTDRDPDWAAARIAEQFPDPINRGPHFGLALAKGRQNVSAASLDLFELANDGQQPAIARATALWLLEVEADADTARNLAPLLADPDPVVRAAAVKLQRAVPGQERVSILASALNDPARNVRIAAAETLLDIPPDAFDATNEEAYLTSIGEWQDATQNHLDFPEMQIKLGGLALFTQDISAAVSAFREAVALDPQRVQIWSLLVRIAAATEGTDQARSVLNEALAFNPDAAVLRGFDRQLP